MNGKRRAWLHFDKEGSKGKLLLPNGYTNSYKRYVMGSNEIPIPVQEVPLVSMNKNGFTCPVLLDYADTNQIRVGPLLGILSIAKGNRLLGNRANFIDIMQTGRKIGTFVFVFTPTDIDWEMMNIQGRIYDRLRKRWITQTLPFPDVVYNRIPNRTYESEPTVAYTLKRLQQIPRLHLYNPHFFDKWELFQILQASDLRPHLPETTLLNQPQTLTTLLHKYPTLYLKPTAGKAGSGIYRIEQINERIRVRSTGSEKSKEHLFRNMNEMWQQLYPKLSQQTYIAQQGIPLLTQNDAPFDVRVLVQKTIHGEWDVTGVGFRCAGKEGITTHVPQGGKILSKEQALVPYFGANGTEQLLLRIKDVAKRIASTLEKQYRLLGEMSMDLGVTADGDIWFFEANAKPMKFDEPTIRALSLRRIIEYCQYLARFV